MLYVFFLYNNFFFRNDPQLQNLNYIELEPLIKVEEEDFSGELSSPKPQPVIVDHLDLTVDDAPSGVPSTSSHCRRLPDGEVIDLTLDD
jgi:hypothetical protein